MGSKCCSTSDGRACQDKKHSGNECCNILLGFHKECCMRSQNKCCGPIHKDGSKMHSITDYCKEDAHCCAKQGDCDKHGDEKVCCNDKGQVRNCDYKHKITYCPATHGNISLADCCAPRSPDTASGRRPPPPPCRATRQG